MAIPTGPNDTVANVTGISAFTVALPEQVLESAISTGDYSQLQDNFTAITVIAANQTYPGTVNETYAANVAVIIAEVDFSLQWANSSVVNYKASIMDALGLPYINNLVFGNQTDYILTFGGVHYDHTLNGGLGDVDYAVLDLNGLYANIPLGK